MMNIWLMPWEIITEPDGEIEPPLPAEAVKVYNLAGGGGAGVV